MSQHKNEETWIDENSNAIVPSAQIDKSEIIIDEEILHCRTTYRTKKYIIYMDESDDESDDEWGF